MRVIAGKAGGIPLLTPKTDLRPTMDMVRGAVFSSLGEMVAGARVLDLFAGCGSLAIEALSRGAASATLVENDRKAVSVIEQNLQKTRLQARVIQADVFRFVERAAATDVGGYSLVFADPPYSKTPGARDFAAELLSSAALPLLLSEGGLFVLEVGKGWPFSDARRWECLKRKQYGSTEVLVLRPMSSSSDSSPFASASSISP